MGYKEDIQIDIDALDKEWVKQAATFQYYAKQEAVALYERDQLADDLTLTQAQLDGDIRLNFGAHGFESKPTEAAILNSIKQNPRYIKANSLLMKASCKAKIVGGAVRAFDHKKKALEKLTDLYLSGYWAAPKIKSEAQEVYGEQAQEALNKDLQKDERMTRLQATQKREVESKIEGKKKTETKKKADKKRDGAKTTPKPKSKTNSAPSQGPPDNIPKTKPKRGKQGKQQKPSPATKPSGKKKK